MKPSRFPQRALIFLVLVLATGTVSVFAAGENRTRPTSFVGVPWGSSISDALRILSARSGVVLPEATPAGPKIELTGGTFAGQPAEKWTLEFAGERFFGATVLLKPAEKTGPGLYRELKQMLIGKYGPVTGEKKAGSGSPDRRERLRANPSDKTLGTLAYWRFNETLSDKQRISIELELAAPAGVAATDESQLALSVRYVNETLKPARGETVSDYKPEPSGRPIKADDL